MAEYEKSKARRHQGVIESYYKLLNETEKQRNKELQAVIAIQRNWRMLKVKWRYELTQRAVALVKRVFRGHLTRIRVWSTKEENFQSRQMAFFHEQAKIVQKFYRGFYSRKYEHDFYARKKYLKHVETKNDEVRRNLEDHNRKLTQEEQKRQEQAARTEFSELASNLHHLTSTRAVPGVYNPPYSQLKPQAFNVDIETHLKSTFKSNYQWKAPDKDKIAFFRSLADEQRKQRI